MHIQHTARSRFPALSVDKIALRLQGLALVFGVGLFLSLLGLLAGWHWDWMAVGTAYGDLYGALAWAANLALALILAAAVLAREAWSVAVAGLALALNLALFLAWQSAVNGLALVGWLLASLWLWQGRAWWRINPVAWKELRSRMRGARAFAILGLFVTLMSGFAIALYALGSAQFSQGQVSETGQIGRALFGGLISAQLVLIIFIVPSLTAGSVTGERERQTYDLLQTTLLSTPTFLMGKMQAALGFMLLLVLSAIPIQSVAFLFGGVSQMEVILSSVGLACAALLLGALGVFFSAFTERTLTATVRVYVLAFVIGIGSFYLSSLVFQGAYQNAINGVATVSDNVSRERLLIYADMFLSNLNPVLAAFSTQQGLTTQGQVLVLNAQLASSAEQIPLVSGWLMLVMSYLNLSGALMLGAMRLLTRRQALEL